MWKITFELCYNTFCKNQRKPLLVLPTWTSQNEAIEEHLFFAEMQIKLVDLSG